MVPSFLGPLLALQTWWVWPLKTLRESNFCKYTRSKYNRSLFLVGHLTGHYFLSLSNHKKWRDLWKSWLHVQLKFLNQMFSPRAFVLHKTIIFPLDNVIRINLKKYFSPNKMLIHLILWRDIYDKIWAEMIVDMRHGKLDLCREKESSKILQLKGLATDPWPQP